MSAAIDELRAKAAERVQLLKDHPAMTELLKILSALNILEELEGQPATTLSGMFGFEKVSTAETNTVLVRPGQYYDMPALEAAKDFLTRKKAAATLDEILEALRTGGKDPGPRERFGVSLARSTFNFVKIGELYDLLDRYPNVKQQRLQGIKDAKRKPVAQATGSESSLKGSDQPET